MFPNISLYALSMIFSSFLWLKGRFSAQVWVIHKSERKYDEDKITFQKNSDGVVYLITIGRDKYKKWGKNGCLFHSTETSLFCY